MANVSLIDGHIDEPRMTDEQIIKALDCCSNRSTKCIVCPYFEKTYCVDRDALDLINRQNAEIERLKQPLFIIDNNDITRDEFIEMLRKTPVTITPCSEINNKEETYNGKEET